MAQKISLIGLQRTAFQHPFDAAASSSLGNVPGFSLVGRLLSEKVVERVKALELKSSSIRVGPGQFPSLFKRYKDLAERLDVRRCPELYISTSSDINAYTTGVENYVIVLNTGLLDILTAEEVDVVLAHELGHVKCDHVKHQTVGGLVVNYGPSLLATVGIPIASTLLAGLNYALVHWGQQAEFSADRAALLATQEPELVQMTLAKLGGFSKVVGEPLSLEAVRAQALDYDEYGDDSLLTKALKLILASERTHPVIVHRVRELASWAASPEYARILRGEYMDSSEVQTGAPFKLCPTCTKRRPSTEIFCGEDGTNLRNVVILPGLPSPQARRD